MTIDMLPGNVFTYAYDGDGRRVKRVVAGITRIYVHNVLGQMVAEHHSPSLAPAGPRKEFIFAGGRLLAAETNTPSASGNLAETKYLTPDHLGSTRVVTDAAATVDSRHDYLPFGKEIPTDFGGRAAVAGYGAEERILQRFTGKEVDPESGLQYFGARYYSGRQGRFTTPDPMMASASARNPQTWNRYVYALNNPLRYFDPDGLEVPESCAKDPNCTIVIKINVIYDKTINKGRGLTDKQMQKFKKEQLAKAKKDFGTSNIKLEVAETHGRYDVGPKGNPVITGYRSDSLNVVVSNTTPTGEAGLSYVDRNTDIAFSFVNVDRTHESNLLITTNTTEHELGHQFLGHVYLNPPGFWENLRRDFEVDIRLFGQSLGQSQGDFREGVKSRRYAVPLNPEAIKPRP